MRVTLRCARVGMTQKLLHHIQADPCIHEIAGIRMAKIMQAQIFKSSPLKYTDGSLVAGEYQTQLGYYQADGTFQESSSGTDTLLLIYTDATAGADEQIVILGVTTLTPDLATNVTTFTFG